MILTGKSLSTLFLISDVTTKEAISGVPIFCLSIIPNLAKFTENEDRDVTDVLAESSFCSKGNLFEDVQQVEEEETTDNSTSSFIHEKDISNLFEDNQQFESISVNLASASPESVSSENEGNESISKLSRLNFSGEKTLINVPFCSGYERNEEDTNSSSCLDSEIEKETHFESERNSISEDDECESDSDSRDSLPFDSFNTFAASTDSSSSSSSSSPDEFSDLFKTADDDYYCYEQSNPMQYFSVGLQTSFKNEPIRIEGRSCLGIIVAERESESDETDTEPGKFKNAFRDYNSFYFCSISA